MSVKAGIVVGMSAQHIVDEELAPHIRSARERVRLCFRLTLGLGIVGLFLMSLAGWWLVAALCFQIAAAISAVVALSTMPRAKNRPVDYVVTVMFLVACLYMLCGTGVQVIFIDQTNEYAQCINNALTISRQNRCTEQLQDNLLATLLGG